MPVIHPPTAMPWYKSKIIIAVIISLLGKLLVATGLIGDLTAEDQQRLVEFIVLVTSGIGDIVAIGSRITQRHAPEITVASTDYSGRIRALAPLVLMAPILLLMAACATTGPNGQPQPSPVPVSEAALIAAEIAGAPRADRAELLLVVTAEVGARFRCPRSPSELTALVAVRLAFDTVARPGLSLPSQGIADRLRVRTNEVCGLTAPG